MSDPQDDLRAAQDPTLSDERIAALARSPYPFVRVALLSHPRITPALLGAMMPDTLKTSGEQELALKLVQHPQTPAAARAQLVARITAPSSLPALVVALCSADLPLAALEPLLSRANSALRSQIAHQSTRADVKAWLQRKKDENKASLPPTPPPKPPPPPPPAPAPSTFAALVTLRQTLSGKVLRREKNQFDRDYSRDTAYYESSQAISLYADGTFRYEERQFMSVSAGTFTFNPGEKHIVHTGTWQVEADGANTVLVLTSNGAVLWRAITRDGGPGVQYLDGEAWNRYRLL